MANLTAPEKNPSICEVGGSGLGGILPLGGDDEQRWHNGIRAVLYLAGLLWCFMGVALISDIFMGAIEKITSKKARKLNAETGRFITVVVWNPTVANLTLMALGSSAPEILLSVIELLGNNFFSGDLGPSTIVGSAAFNLFCISAVCVGAIPDKEVRCIKDMSVYSITASFSVLAYVWLLVILMMNTENVVNIWEGVLTFMYFPFLVSFAFLADRGYFSKADPDNGVNSICSADMTKEELAALETSIRRKHGMQITEEQVAKFIECEHGEPTSRAKYRVAATRAATGGKRVPVPNFSSMAAKTLHLNSVVPSDSTTTIGKEEPQADANIIEFEAATYAVLEDANEMQLAIYRKGKDHSSVGYRTRDGTAKANTDYKPIEGRADFPPGVDRVMLLITIIDDSAMEDDEEFYLDLFDPECQHGVAMLGENATTTIVIIDDDLPGIFQFKEETATVEEEINDKTLSVLVQRASGSTGKVTCKYHTEDGSAKNGAEFDACEGVLEFEGGQMSNTIKVNIKGSGRYESCENFRIVLSEPTGGAKFDPKTDGGATSAILTVLIKSDVHAKARIDRMMSKMQVGWDKTKVGNANWREQFVGALYVNGGDDDEDSGPATVKDWVVHIILLPWKLLFAIVPPTDYMDGWACFCSALMMIGLVTAIIGDMAALLGCVMTVPDKITAITFVALGTSLPDTFASKAAATQDPYADASIGNVTGSNSVNVFLGLGLPWMLGAVYWRCMEEPSEDWLRKYGHLDFAQQYLKAVPNPDGIGTKMAWESHGQFIVIAGSLGFSVIVFSTCAAVAIFCLYIRRILFQGELGGPTIPKHLTSAFFIFLWLVYIGLSSWKCLSDD